MDIKELSERVRNKSGRDVFGDVVLEMGYNNGSIVLLNANSTKTMRCAKFASEFPRRAFDVGIAEQNLVGVGAGLVVAGMLPFILMYGFLAARVAEQIRDDLCYPNLNAKVVAMASGLVLGEGGATHQCTEDLGILRTFANLTIVQPASSLETLLAARGVVEQVSGPAFLRIPRIPYSEEAEQALEDFYVNGGRFKIGEAITLREGYDVTLIGSGLLVGVALQAASALEKEGISTRVLNAHTIKPLDERSIVDAATNTSGIVTMEDHNILGGLGEAVCGVVCEAAPTVVKRVGINDTFCEIGPMDALCSQYGLCAENVVGLVRNLLESRGRQ